MNLSEKIRERKERLKCANYCPNLEKFHIKGLSYHQDHFRPFLEKEFKSVSISSIELGSKINENWGEQFIKSFSEIFIGLEIRKDKDSTSINKYVQSFVLIKAKEIEVHYFRQKVINDNQHQFIMLKKLKYLKITDIISIKTHEDWLESEFNWDKIKLQHLQTQKIVAVANDKFGLIKTYDDSIIKFKNVYKHMLNWTICSFSQYELERINNIIDLYGYNIDLNLTIEWYNEGNKDIGFIDSLFLTSFKTEILKTISKLSITRLSLNIKPFADYSSEVQSFTLQLSD